MAVGGGGGGVAGAAAAADRSCELVAVGGEHNIQPMEPGLAASGGAPGAADSVDPGGRPDQTVAGGRASGRRMRPPSRARATRVDKLSRLQR